jgi:hypothetical protein
VHLCNIVGAEYRHTRRIREATTICPLFLPLYTFLRCAHQARHHATLSSTSSINKSGFCTTETMGFCSDKNPPQMQLRTLGGGGGCDGYASRVPSMAGLEHEASARHISVTCTLIMSATLSSTSSTSGMGSCCQKENHLVADTHPRWGCDGHAAEIPGVASLEHEESTRRCASRRRHRSRGRPLRAADP